MFINQASHKHLFCICEEDLFLKIYEIHCSNKLQRSWPTRRLIEEQSYEHNPNIHQHPPRSLLIKLNRYFRFICFAFYLSELSPCCNNWNPWFIDVPELLLDPFCCVCLIIFLALHFGVTNLYTFQFFSFRAFVWTLCCFDI